MNSISLLHRGWNHQQASWSLTEILHPFKEVLLQKGDTLLHYNKKENEIYFIVKGKMMVYLLNDQLGKETTYRLLMNGEFLNSDIMIEEGGLKKKAIAKSDTLVKVIPLLAFHKLMDEHMILRQIVLRGFQIGQQEFFQKLQRLEWMNTRKRILLFLVDYVEKAGKAVGFEWVVRNFLTHQELGSLCSASRQSVTTVLNDLRYQKIIHFNRRYLLIRDFAALKDNAARS